MILIILNNDNNNTETTNASSCVDGYVLLRVFIVHLIFPSELFNEGVTCPR